MNDLAAIGELSQGRADFGGANAAELLQLLDRDRFLQLSQCLAHPLRWGERSLRLNRGALHYLQGHDGTCLAELERDVVLARGGPVFGG